MTKNKFDLFRLYSSKYVQNANIILTAFTLLSFVVFPFEQDIKTIIFLRVPQTALFILSVTIWYNIYLLKRKQKLKRKLKTQNDNPIVSQRELYKKYSKRIQNIIDGVIHSGHEFESITSHESDSFERISHLAHEAWDYEKLDAKKGENKGEQETTIKERKSYMANLIQLNNNVLSSIIRNNRIIGYTSVLPMKSGDHFAGIKSQYSFDFSDVSNETQSNLIYVQAVYLIEEARDREKEYENAIRCLISQIAFYTKDIEKTIVYAEAFTDNGIKLLNNVGFKKTNRQSMGDANGNNSKDIYILCLNWDKQVEIGLETPNYFNAVKTIEAIKKLKS